MSGCAEFQPDDGWQRAAYSGFSEHLSIPFPSWVPLGVVNLQLPSVDDVRQDARPGVRDQVFARKDVAMLGASTPTARVLSKEPAHSLPPGSRLPRAAQTVLARYAVVPLLRAMRRRYGPFFTLRALPWGTAVVVADASLIKQVVLAGDFAHLATDVRSSVLAPVLGGCCADADDEPRNARGGDSAPVRWDLVHGFERAVEFITAREIKTWPLLEDFALHPRLRAVTLEATLNAIIGVSDRGRLDALRRVVPASIKVRSTLMATQASAGRLRCWRASHADVVQLNNLLLAEIVDRRRRRGLGERHDFLSWLIAAGQCDDREARDEIVALLLFAHDTGPAVLAWAFERLLRHSATLARATEGEDAYLDAVIRETMRVRPIMPAVVFRLAQPLVLEDFDIPAGMTVMVAVPLLHADPELFAEPQSFRPARFLEDDQTSTCRCTPFASSRCGSAALARLQMRVILRTILGRARLRACHPADEKVRCRHLALVPARETQVVREGWACPPQLAVAPRRAPWGAATS